MAVSGRIPHAQIFLGKEGSGSLGLALAFAQMLQCTDKTSEGLACSACNACQKAQKFIHPDIHFSYPTIGTKVKSTDFIKEWRSALAETLYLDVQTWLAKLGAENKQGNITVDETADILKKISLKKRYLCEASLKFSIGYV